MAMKTENILDYVENKSIYNKRNIQLPKIKNISNPTSVHGIYPYRGKISAKDAINVISQFSPDNVLLDPFCGTGTIVYEGYRHGLNVIGMDANPLANIITKGKMNLRFLEKERVLKEVNRLIEKASSLTKFKHIPKESEKGFHKDTAEQIMRMQEIYDEMSDYMKAIFCGTICVTARGCNNYLWTSSTVGKDIHPKRYINFFDKLKIKTKKHFFTLENDNKVTIHQKDARDLSKYVKVNSIDYVFTSPPYFDALDYTAYYAKFVFPILNIDRLKVKKDLIQSTKTYEKDMNQVLNEILRVTKDNALIIFVVGDKKIGGEIINGGEFFSTMLHHQPTKIIERTYSGSASQVFDVLNKTQRKEQIVIWDKSTW